MGWVQGVKGIPTPTPISPSNGSILNNTNVTFLWDGNYRGVWTDSVQYNPGDIINYSGSIYQLINFAPLQTSPTITSIGNQGNPGNYYQYNLSLNISASINSDNSITLAIPSLGYVTDLIGKDSTGKFSILQEWVSLWATGGYQYITYLKNQLSTPIQFTPAGAFNAWYYTWIWGNTIQIDWPNPYYLSPPQDLSWQLIISGSYEYQLAHDYSFNNIINDFFQSGSVIDINNLPYNEYYYWKVRYITSNSNGPWTSPWYFQIMSQSVTPTPAPKIFTSPIKNLPPDFRPDPLIKYIVIHHTETDSSLSSVDINQQAINDQYFGAPYDIIIDKIGKMAVTPQWINASTSNQIITGVSIKDILSYTLHPPAQDMEVASLIMTSINIGIIGDFNRTNPTFAQGVALQQILTALQTKYDISAIYYHRDISNTSCPGNNFFSKKYLNINDLGSDIYSQTQQQPVPIEAGFQIMTSTSNT